MATRTGINTHLENRLGQDDEQIFLALKAEFDTGLHYVGGKMWDEQRSTLRQILDWCSRKQIIWRCVASDGASTPPSFATGGGVEWCGARAARAARGARAS